MFRNILILFDSNLIQIYEGLQVTFVIDKGKFQQPL